MKLFKNKQLSKEDVFKLIIIDILDRQINRLKPEIKKKIKIIIRPDEFMSNKKTGVSINAECIWEVKPNIIIIYLPSLIGSFYSIMTDNVINLLRHELTHILLEEKDEKKVEQKLRKIDIFKDEK